MSRSHVVFALRQWLYQRGPVLDDRGFDSEGTWEDVVSVGATAIREKNELVGRAAGADTARIDRLAAINEGLERKRVEIAVQMAAAFPGGDSERLRYSGSSPGDIVGIETEANAEAARTIRATARHIRSGVAYRNALAAKLDPNRANHRDVAATIAAERALSDERAAIARAPRHSTHVPSALEPELRTVVAIAHAHGAELVVVALPIDVQVATAEWKKYGITDPPDMTPTRVLLADLVESAERLGARAIDATAALERVSGAFLDKDIHLTPAGHLAVAEAIAERLAGPPAVRLPAPGLPEGRSRIPSLAEWRFAPEITVVGSSAARCETFFIREWFRVSCTRNEGRSSGIEVVRGGRGEAMAVTTDHGSILTMPILPGDEVEVALYWERAKKTLSGARDSGAALPTLAIQSSEPDGRELRISEPDRHLCNCQIEVEPEHRYEGETCTNIVGAPTRECMDAYADDCESLLLCARGDALALPPCAPGFANAGGSGQCFQMCSSEVACAEGKCTPWQGTSVCR